MPVHEDIPKSSQLFLKLRYVFIPILTTSILSILILTSIHWYLDYKLDVVDISKDFLLWILAIVALIIWGLFMRKRVNLLRAKVLKDNGLLHYLAGGALYAPLLIAQFYLIEHTATLTELDSLVDIQQIRDGDYLKVKDYKINRNATACYYNVQTVGRYNEDVFLNASYVIPIESQNSKYQFWIAKQLSTKHSTRAYKNNQDYLWGQFQKEKEIEIAKINPYKYKYLKVVVSSDNRVLFKSATKYSPIYASVKGKVQVFLEPVNDDFSKRYQGEQKWFFISFIGLHTILLVIVLFMQIDEQRLKKYLKNENTPEDEDFKEFLAFIIPSKGHYITSTMIILNILVFVIMISSGMSMMNPLAKDLMEFGALRYQEVMQGDYWRLLTAGFIHVGIIHLVMNILALGITGPIVEMTIGRWRFLILYLITLIGGNVNSLYWSHSGVSAGASGAIFGLMGWMISQIIVNKKSEGTGLRIAYIGIVLTLGGITLLVGIFNNSNNAAHLGGLAIGLLVGLGFDFYDWLFPPKKKPIKAKK